MSQQQAAAAVKKPWGLGKKLMVGGLAATGLLGAGSMIGGGMQAAKMRAAQPLAPPEDYPPGY